ncbi:putative ribonuclease H-like domain-containing protein [Tanacetum coccineum]
MTGNKSYLTDYEEIDRGFVAFGVPRKDNMYSVDLKNVVPQGGITCLFPKATPDESNLWHRRLGHVNFKTMNKPVRGSLVRGLPSKLFEINQTCVACQKGKQHRASCIENLIDLRVKVIRCDNGTEFKNRVMNQFYEMNGIKREFSVARTPQQNGVAERKNRTLIEAARTMLADLKLPTTFWAKAVNPACYVQNRVLVIKPYNKTPYELFLGIKHVLSFMRPFGCPVTILNTIDHLGKFDGKADEGFFVGYSTNSKAFRVFNSRTRIVEENMHVQFSENTPNITGSGPIARGVPPHALKKSINNKPVVAGNQSNGNASTKACDDIGEKKDAEDLENKDSEIPSTEEPRVNQEKDANINNTNNIDTVSPTVNAAGIKDNAVDENIVYECANDLNMPNLEEIDYSDDNKDVGVEADMTNLNTHIPVNPIIARIEAIRLFLAYASYKDFMVYQMDVKSAFLYGNIEKEVYVCQPLDNGFQRGQIDKTFFIKRVKGDILLVQVYVDDIIFRSTKKVLCTEFEKLMHKKFQMISMGELTFFLGLQVTQKDDGIFISQDKYVDEILKKFGFSTMKTASTPMETSKPLMKDESAEDVDVHLYRSMIGSLIYLTSSRPDIMFDVCACARFQVTPKFSHLHDVKRIFRYLKGQPKLGLWYPKDSPFDLEAYTDSDYAGASLDRKSTIGGCQFLRRRLISWQCKKQTIVANSTTEAESVAASSCCRQVLWIQNQMLDYGYNFMNTKIHIDNESTICIVKNLVFHSKTKHIEIRHHFIRDSNEKKLI